MNVWDCGWDRHTGLSLSRAKSKEDRERFYANLSRLKAPGVSPPLFSKQEYLQWRREWKMEYIDLSNRIKEQKKSGYVNRFLRLRARQMMESIEDAKYWAGRIRNEPRVTHVKFTSS